MLTIKLSNKAAYTLIVILSILTASLVVYAYSNIPNPGHGGDNIVINIGGQEKTLQQAIDEGDFGKYSPGEGIDITNNIISIKSPTSTKKGGIKSVSCPAGQAITSIDSTGTPSCGTSLPSGAWYSLEAVGRESCVSACARYNKQSSFNSNGNLCKDLDGHERNAVQVDGSTYYCTESPFGPPYRKDEKLAQCYCV